MGCAKSSIAARGGPKGPLLKFNRASSIVNWTTSSMAKRPPTSVLNYP